MLSRNAQGLYWISRYMERAEHGCRLLQNQFLALQDRPVEELDRTWSRLYLSLGREPIGGGLGSNLGDDDFMLADAYTLTDDVTFEPNNADSIRNCVASARENARQVRNVIGNDMWSSLNMLYLGIRDLRVKDIWGDRSGNFYLRTEDSIRTFHGIADSSMYRDDGWHFLQLGRFVERVQHLTGLLDAHLDVFPSHQRYVESDWRSLLQICTARVAYSRLYTLDFKPSSVIDFLVSDPLLSHSIRHSLDRIITALQAVTAQRPLALGAVRRVGRVAANLDFDWPRRDPGDDAATRATLGMIGDECRPPARAEIRACTSTRLRRPRSSRTPSDNRGCHLFNVHRLHRSTEVHTRVQVESAGDRQLPERLGAGAWEALTAAVDPVALWQFLQPSHYVRFNSMLEEFTAANGIRRGDDPLVSLLQTCSTLHRVFQYEPGSTAVDSPMEHILETGQGVCQDYTHVMLAIGRSWGIPSRYVSGYIHREGAAGEQSLAGASHAWGEFFLPDLGWVGIDPTNDTVADHRFIAVAVGRDYADASPTRGTVLGGGESTLDVKVTVVSEDETAPDWSPHREWPNLRTVAPTPREYSHRFDQ